MHSSPRCALAFWPLPPCGEARRRRERAGGRARGQAVAQGAVATVTAGADILLGGVELLRDGVEVGVEITSMMSDKLQARA